MTYEYKVVPAPTRGLKAKGVKTSEARFAHALQTLINAQANDGWEYLRTDTLPAEQREGLMGKKTTVYQNMLVFRRTRDADAQAITLPPEPQLTSPPPKTPETEPETEVAEETLSDVATEETDDLDLTADDDLDTEAEPDKTPRS